MGVTKNCLHTKSLSNLFNSLFRKLNLDSSYMPCSTLDLRLVLLWFGLGLEIVQ